MIAKLARCSILLLLVLLVSPALAKNDKASQKPNASIKEMTTEKKSQEVMEEEARKEKENTIAQPEETQAVSFSGVNVHSLGIGIGQTSLHGDLGKNGNDAVTFTDILYNYSASYSFDLLLDLHSSKHKLQNRFSRAQGLAIGIKPKFYQYDAFAPFAVGGLGFYRPTVVRVINNQLVRNESKTVLGYHLGAGCDLRLNKHYMVGVLGAFHDPFDVQQENGQPDVSASYFKLLITGMYSF